MKNTYKVLILTLIMSMACLWMISCGKLGTADFGTIPTTDSGTTYSSITFAGIDSITEVRGNGVKLNWTHVSGAISYKVYNTTSGSKIYLGAIDAPTTSYSVTGLTLNTTYKFRVNLVDLNENIDSNTNDVSISTLTLGCPDNYIVVPHNDNIGTTTDFCVAKYEMTCAADTSGASCSGSPISQAGNKPWVNVRHSEAADRAKELCEGLGTGYHLITNKEWMTIARNIETNTEYQSYNWSGGSVGSGYIHNGHSDTSPTVALATPTNVSEICYGTVSVGVNPSCEDGGAQQRTHTLSNGEVIWDFAGNVWEWVDWEVDYTTLRSDKAIPPNGLGGNWREYYVNPNTTTPTISMPTTSFESADNTLTSVNRIGKYYPGNNGAGGAVLRGGARGNTDNAGIYTLDLSTGIDSLHAMIGFRCSYSE